jgi:hypothetical protein
MLRLWNKLPVFLSFIIFVSCGFIDLRPIGISIQPDSMNALLPEPFSPVILRFDTEMDKNNTESILQISSDSGTTRGDKFWRGNDLYFVPVSGWTAGIRYTINLMGTMRSVDGRELRIEHFIPFYAINRNDPPLLKWHSPSSGASTGTNNVIFEFHFSLPMDRLSVEAALTLEGIGGKTFDWHDNDQLLKVTPDKALSPWVMYRWNLRDTAKSMDGVPLAKAYSGHFITDLDQTLPQVTSVYPVQFIDGSWYPTGANIETGLRQGQGIAVEFNKTMGENVLRSVRFEPSLTGKTEYLSESSIVYIFTREPEPSMYTLIISGDTRDSEGLKIGNDFKTNFVPDIPYLNILSITTGDGTVLDNFSAINNVLPVRIDPATGRLSFSIHFSFLFGREEKLNTPLRITLSPFFPKTLMPVALQYVNWISSDRLYMRWEGLIAGDSEDHFYKLTIPGGRGGISSASGFFLERDITIYFEVIKLK